MENTLSETFENATADLKREPVGSGQAQGEPAQPTPVDDLAKRVKLLREAGVRAYKDGPLELIFAPAPRSSLSLAEMALAERATADSERYPHV